MVGVSQEQQIAAMPEGMAKRIILKILNAPKAPVKKLEKECQKIEERIWRARNAK